MHPTQHSTHNRTPRVQQPSTARAILTTVILTQDDILNAITQIAAKQCTCFVSIYHLGLILGLTEEDCAWLCRELEILDSAQRVLLNALDRPQDLLSSMRPWAVRNASGIPCHEVCRAPDSHRLKPPLAHNATATPRRAPDTSTLNPTVQQRRVSKLVEGAARVLISFGNRPQTQVRVVEAFTGEAA